MKMVDCLMLEKVVFNVGESNVREWRKAETVLKSLHKRKRAMRFRRCLWPTIEIKTVYLGC